MRQHYRDSLPIPWTVPHLGRDDDLQLRYRKPAGRLVQRGEPDAWDPLGEAAQGSGDAEHRWNGCGGRLFQTSAPATGTTQFLYDGDALVAEYNGGGVMKNRYVHGDGADDPLVWYPGNGTATPHYLYADHQGSVVAVTDANGAKVRINSHDDYGTPASGNLGRTFSVPAGYAQDCTPRMR